MKHDRHKVGERNGLKLRKPLSHGMKVVTMIHKEARRSKAMSLGGRLAGLYPKKTRHNRGSEVHCTQ